MRKLSILITIILFTALILLAAQGADINNILFNSMYNNTLQPTNIDRLQLAVTGALLVNIIASILLPTKEA